MYEWIELFIYKGYPSCLNEDDCIWLPCMRWDAALDSFSLSVWLNTLELFVTLDFGLETSDFLDHIEEFSRFMILEFMLLFHVVTWLSKINVKCQRQQWSVSLVQINHHYVRKMEQKRLSVNSWTSKIWVMASKMLGNNDNDSWLHLGVRIRWINNACFAKMQF